MSLIYLFLGGFLFATVFLKDVIVFPTPFEMPRSLCFKEKSTSSVPATHHSTYVHVDSSMSGLYRVLCDIYLHRCGFPLLSFYVLYVYTFCIRVDLSTSVLYRVLYHMYLHTCEFL